MSFIDVTLISFLKKERLSSVRIHYSDPKAHVRSVVRSAIRKTVLNFDMSAPFVDTVVQSEGKDSKTLFPFQGGAGGADDEESRRSCSSPSPQSPSGAAAVTPHTPQQSDKSNRGGVSGAPCSIVRVRLISSSAAGRSSAEWKAMAGASASSPQVLLDDLLCEVVAPGEELLAELEGWAVDQAVAKNVHLSIPADDVEEMVRLMKRRRLEALKQSS